MMESEKKELVRKFAIDNGGKWPCDSHKFLVINRSNRKTVSVLDLEVPQGTFYIPLCTRTEYLDFVESEFFEGAPNKAEYYSPSKNLFFIGYQNNYAVYIDGCGTEGWSKVDWRVVPNDLINRPQKQEKTVEHELHLVLKVGVKCEFMCTHKEKEAAWQEGIVRYISRNTCVMGSDCHDTEFVAHPDTMQFRPLKTEAEKEREELEALGCAVAYNSFHLENTEEKNCLTIAKAFIDAGWRPAK